VKKVFPNFAEMIVWLDARLRRMSRWKSNPTPAIAKSDASVGVQDRPPNSQFIAATSRNNELVRH
jgi:hypothetical protein